MQAGMVRGTGGGGGQPCSSCQTEHTNHQICLLVHECLDAEGALVAMQAGADG